MQRKKGGGRRPGGDGIQGGGLDLGSTNFLFFILFYLTLLNDTFAFNFEGY